MRRLQTQCWREPCSYYEWADKGNAIKSIDCPLGNEPADICPWVKRNGTIRDYPMYGVEECSKCHLVSHERDLREFIDYESGSMHSWTAGYGGTLETPKQDISRRVEAIRTLSQIHPVKRILDFGSGKGEMIAALSEFFSVEGLEPEEQARAICMNEGKRVSASIDELTKSSAKFDLVVLFHVVEHFYSPRIELARIFDLLNPGGLVILETPNAKDALLTEYQNEAFSNFTYWSHHPMLHSSVSLSNLVTSAGFTNIDVKTLQRYGLANHLYWMTHQKAGGHVYWGDKFSPASEASYAQDLISRGIADTLWLTASKPI
jgi:2-polyprenyl-3-methyl-5-hydroxy-6-metoxy-1,4-benzoquinol methylase